MHFRTIAVACVLSAMTLVAAAHPAGSAGSASSIASAPAPFQQDTATLYRINCQMCHGANGKALIPEMAFVGRAKWKHGTKSADMVKVITEGVKGTPMISFKSKFTPAQIKALALYVRAFDKRLPPEK